MTDLTEDLLSDNPQGALALLPQPGPEEFANAHCDLRLDQSGGGCRVAVSCHAVGPDGQVYQAERQVDIGPLLDRLSHRFIEAHEAQYHGQDVTAGAVCGSFFDDAVSSLRSVVTSKAVGDLLDDPTVRAASAFLPGGTQALAATSEIRKLVTDAKQGDPNAKAKLTAIRAAADAGDPGAKSALAVAKSASRKVKPKGFYDRGLSVGHDPMTISGPPPLGGAHGGVSVTNTNQQGGRIAPPKQGQSGYFTRDNKGVAVDQRTTSPDGFIPGKGWVDSRYQDAYFNSLKNWGAGALDRLAANTEKAQISDSELWHPGDPDPGAAQDQGLSTPGPTDPNADPYAGQYDPYAGQYGYPPPGFDPFGGFDPYAQPDPYGYGGYYDPTEPIATQAQVYDPTTDSFFAQSNTPQGLPQQYDPDTDSFHPVLAVDTRTNRVIAGGALDDCLRNWAYSRHGNRLARATGRKLSARSLYGRGLAA